ncbi:MAG TPA: hypothetical protein DCQ31_04155 [Bacteroidales bacterium]|nr:hypothetical protein [Bacteroidales bacterium]
MNNGITHNDRYLKELDAQFFKVDERSLDDFMDFITKFSKLIAFYDANNNLDGDASQILENDITVLLLQISSLDIEHIDGKFELLLQDFKEKHIDVKKDVFASARIWLKAMKAKQQSEEKLIGFLLELHQQIENWNLKTVTDVDFNYEIRKLIETKFSKTLARLIAFDKLLIAKGLIEPRKRIINYLRKPEWQAEEYSYPVDFFSEEKEKYFDSITSEELHDLFHNIQYSLSPIIKSANRYSQKYLSDGNTRPHVALFITFIEMYKHAQYDINQFTQRHLDYFYNEILKFNRQPENADNVFLTFTVQDSVEVCKIPENARLLAGQDSEGNDLIYHLDNELIVSKASIDYRRAIVNEIKAVSAAENNFEYVNLNNNVNKTDYAENKEVSDFFMGISLVSSFLKLSEGDRTVKIALELQRYSFDKFLTLFETEVKNNIDLNVPTIDEFAAQLFSFSYSTTEDGEQSWYTVPENKITTKFQKNSDGNPINRLTIIVEISTLAPPIDSCISDRFPEAKAKNLPVCHLLINNRKLIFYNYFKVLVIEKIHLATGVNGIRDLIIQNDYGLVDASSPFEPFTATPAIGSTLYIGHETIFSQHLDKLELVFDWHDIPIDANGFPEYYEGYSSVESNEVFKASLSFLKNRKWYPENNKQLISLFQDGEVDPDNGTVAVSSTTVVDTIDLKDINFHFSGPPVLNLEDSYSRICKNGFLKLEFAFPQPAFGHKEYLNIIKREAGSIKKGGQMQIPNAPWTPTLRGLSINYTSSIIIDIQNQDPLNKAYIYHVHPFGEKIISEPIGREINLLPQYPLGTELILGIRNFNIHELLSIFFQINEFSSDIEEEKPEVHWTYLNQDEWLPIKYEQLVGDSTNDLSNSGIIVFDFASFDKDYFNAKSLFENRSYTPNIFWLKCKSLHGEEFVHNIRLIELHAASATYKNNGNAKDHLEKPMPANSIKRFIDDIADIKAISQPFESVNGKPEESQLAFQTRVSERLNHKNRAITLWDYEHIILQHFPMLHKAICLNHLNSELKPEPGSVLIVVLPKITAQDRLAKVMEPRTTASQLQLVKETLIEKCSPFAKIEVVNPRYEQVQVRCDVKFAEGLNERFYLQKMNEDLKAFLNPWDSVEDSSVEFNNKIFAMHVVYFLDTRPYVDYVTNLALFHIVNQGIYNIETASENNTVLEPTTDISIFVSAEEHIIKVVGAQVEIKAIGAMMIGKDFSAEHFVEKRTFKGIESDQIEISHQVDPDNEIIQNDTKFVFSFKNFFSE